MALARGVVFGQLYNMESGTPTWVERTTQPRYANGERKLARNVVLQVTWGLLGLTAVTQLFLLVWLDVV